ncbi:MAG TPA: hypothetical protein VGH65_10085 [Verrucomicrobiaceae bacterium]
MVRPPLVIPGVADIEVRSSTPGLDTVTIAPIPLVGEASKHPPVPDTMTKPARDAQFFAGNLWIMRTGSWQVRFVVSGRQGRGVLSIPVAATSTATRQMQSGLGILLAGLGILLIAGMVGIVGAAAREAQTAPGELVPSTNKTRTYVAMAITFSLLLAAVVFGRKWWNAEAADYSSNIYKPPAMHATLETGDVLDLKMTDPGWLDARKLNDFVLDHNHLMHLYAIRWPAMDVVFHLHPELVRTGEFQLALPSMPAGEYRLYADVVHVNGFPETLVTSIALPEIGGRPLTGDDAEGTPGAGAQTNATYRLPDGYTMQWKRPAAMAVKAPEEFMFQLLDSYGQPPQDMALYMGMVGHAAFVKSDGTVFAHIHPSGTMAMAALMMAEAQNGGESMAGMDMSGSSRTPNTVSFPYGFPSPGNYRIFVQMKHGNVVETGAFDAQAK